MLETGVVNSSKPNTVATLDRLAIPQQYHNIIFRRVVAYLIDVVIVGGLMAIAFVAISISGLFTFGLGFALIWPVLFIIPIAYQTFLIGGPFSADPGNAFHGH